MGWLNTNIPRRRRRRLVNTGDLDTIINLQRRELATQFITGDGDEMQFKTFASPWAMVTTHRGKDMFDDVEIGTQFTHEFTMRYRADLEQDTWVQFEGHRYDILDVEDLEERHEFLVLRCKLTGSNDNEGSKG